MFWFLKTNAKDVMKEVRHFDPEISYILSMFSDFGEIIEAIIDQIFAVTLVFFLLILVIYCLLIVGVARDCRCLLVPFLFLETLEVIFVGLSLSNISIPEEIDTTFAIAVAESIVWIALGTYFILVVISHFQELGNAQNCRAENSGVSGEANHEEETDRFIESKV